MVPEKKILEKLSPGENKTRTQKTKTRQQIHFQFK